MDVIEGEEDVRMFITLYVVITVSLIGTCVCGRRRSVRTDDFCIHDVEDVRDSNGLERRAQSYK